MSGRVLYINVTRKCNVFCQACFLKPENRRADRHELSGDLVEAVLAHPFWADHDDVTVIFQGGEVSLMGPGYLNDMSRRIQRTAPHAQQVVVTNLFRLPPWLLEWIAAYRVWPETTFSSEGKMSYDGDRDRYVGRFLRHLDAMWDAGWPCRVNVDITRGMYERGVDDFVEMIVNSRCRGWDFEAAIQFDEFLANPVYGRYGYPVLPMAISHAERGYFLLDMWTRWGGALTAHGFDSCTFQSPRSASPSKEFNVEKEMDFVTLNPDATVTTNPLYADLEPTYIGDLTRESFDAVLAHPNRRGRAVIERRRLADCGNCRYIGACAGGTSHVPVFDGSGECAGLYELWRHFDPHGDGAARAVVEA